MELISIFSNGHKVLANGTVVGFENNPTFEFEFFSKGSENENDFRFKIIMEFKEDEEKEGIHVESEADQEGNVLTIKCTNFNNEIGTGLKRAVEVATVKGKKVYLRYVCYKMNQLPVLTYSVYEE